jgi:hypothetical protein
VCFFRNTTPHPDSQRAFSNATPARNPGASEHDFTDTQDWTNLNDLVYRIKLEDDKGTIPSLTTRLTTRSRSLHGYVCLRFYFASIERQVMLNILQSHHMISIPLPVTSIALGSQSTLKASIVRTLALHAVKTACAKIWKSFLTPSSQICYHYCCWRSC